MRPHDRSGSSEDVEAATARVAESFRRRYHVELADCEITDVPGYWRKRVPCGGLRGGCYHEIHHCLFNEGSINHSVSYFDPPRISGKFASRTRTWDTIKHGDNL